MPNYPDIRDREILVKQIARDVETMLWQLINAELPVEAWYDMEPKKRIQVGTNITLEQAQRYNIKLTQTEFDYIMTKLVL